MLFQSGFGCLEVGRVNNSVCITLPTLKKTCLEITDCHHHHHLCQLVVRVKSVLLILAYEVFLTQ